MIFFDIGSPPIKTVVGLSFPFRRLCHHFMKEEERAVARALERVYPQLGKLVEQKDQYSPFDFECNQYIIEVKCRSKFYDPWFIEMIKYDSNMDLSEAKSKDFLFLTEVGGKAYVYNITKMTKDKFPFTWKKKWLPETTEFKDGSKKTIKVEKDVAYLPVNKSKKVKLWNPRTEA